MASNSKKDLTEDDIKMLIANTQFDRQQVLEWFDRFKVECKDGQLDKKAFIKFYQELLPNTGNSEQFAKYVFKGNILNSLKVKISIIVITVVGFDI